MRDIARESGVRLGNIYNYFRNKDEIFIAIVKPAKEAIFTFITQRHTEENVNLKPMQCFREAFTGYLPRITYECMSLEKNIIPPCGNYCF